MKIVAFFDGRPGHEKQTKGILEAVAALCPLHVEDVHLPPNSWFKNILLSGNTSLFSGADLLLGTGTATHAPMLAAKLRHRWPVATAMAPEPLWRWAFDLCFVPVHDSVKAAKNIFPTIGPATPLTDRGRHDAARGLILVGGTDPKSHSWNDHEIIGNIMEILAAEKDITWHISSSPRTPAITETALSLLPEQFPSCRFFPYKETPAGWVENEYDASGQVWVTADSISMIYEALTAGCAVGLLPVSWRQPGNKFQRSIDYLVEHDFIRLLADWRTGNRLQPPPAPLAEARRCAEEIVRRWCQKN
ncbi:MAG: mitochondrial fission ELM1 family protein [Desulfobulbaceae bacterium]|jgi:mitochondrial fission protein ELM1|nr:mitochondrial fission ELM1 family protein [Desulfobulbaceae bacterium]